MRCSAAGWREGYIASMPKTLVFTVLWRLCTTYCTRKDVTGVHAFDDHAQNTGICSAFVSLRVAGCGLQVNTLDFRNRNTMQQRVKSGPDCNKFLGRPTTLFFLQIALQPRFRANFTYRKQQGGLCARTLVGDHYPS